MSAGLLAFLARQLDFAEIRAIIVRPNAWLWLPAALLLFNASKVVGALRLNIYQRHAGVVLPEAENLRLYYAGMFLNLFLPGGIGGDGYKILVLHRRQAAPVKQLILFTLADRISGLLCLLLLLCLLVPLLALPWHLPWLRPVAVACAAAILAAIFIGHYLVFRLGPAVSARIFLYGLAVQLLQLACIALLLAYVQLPLAHYLPYLAVFLVSSVVAVLPLSLGGIGAREVTFFYCLKLLALDPAYGVVVSTCFFLLGLASSLPGMLYLKRFPLHKARQGTGVIS